MCVEKSPQAVTTEETIPLPLLNHIHQLFPGQITSLPLQPSLVPPQAEVLLCTQ